MALILTEEQMMVRDNARAFLADKAPVAHLRKLRDTRDADGFSRALWKAFAEMGFCGLLLPENSAGRGSATSKRGVDHGGDRPQPDAVAVPVDGACSAATALLRDGNRRAQQAKLAAEHRRRATLLGARRSTKRTKHAPSALRSRRERSGNGFGSAATNVSCSTATWPTFSSWRRAAPARRVRPTASRSFSSRPRRRASTASAP